MIILYSKSCAFLWVANFWCHTTGFTNLDTFTTFHHLGLWLSIIGRSFTRGRIYPCLLILNTFSLPFYLIVRLCWMLSHLTKPTQSNTKCSVDSSTMHSHPLNALSPCICNAICHCMLFHAICMMNATWTTQFTPLTRYHG